MPNSRIAQNFTYEDDPLNPLAKIVKWHAVATAVIEVPSGRTEYDRVDLRLKIVRDGEEIIDRGIYYDIPIVDVSTVPVPFNPNQNTLIQDPYAIYLDPASLYLTLPASRAALDPAFAQLDLPTDGTPPNFTQLKAAVIKVLKKDPATIADTDLDRQISELKLEECRHIAYEIVWGQQVEPLPQVSISTLEPMYTSPDKDKPRSDREQFKIDASRKRLEAELTRYYTTHNAEAEQLTQYIFAVSAAIICQQQTEQSKPKNSKRVGFEFPLIPTTPVSAGKIKEAKVVLFNP